MKYFTLEDDLFSGLPTLYSIEKDNGEQCVITFDITQVETQFQVNVLRPNTVDLDADAYVNFPTFDSVLHYCNLNCVNFRFAVRAVAAFVNCVDNQRFNLG